MPLLSPHGLGFRNQKFFKLFSLFIRFHGNVISLMGVSLPAYAEGQYPRVGWLFLDLNSYFASVEQQDRPELRGRPVVVGGDGDPAKRGVVSTASYEARAFGVHSGLALRTAPGNDL